MLCSGAHLQRILRAVQKKAGEQLAQHLLLRLRRAHLAASSGGGSSRRQLRLEPIHTRLQAHHHANQGHDSVGQGGDALVAAASPIAYPGPPGALHRLQLLLHLQKMRQGGRRLLLLLLLLPW